MDADSSPLCFQCGLPTGSQQTLNRLQSGQPCPQCQARLLEDLPPALPGMGKGMPAGYGGLGGEAYSEEEVLARYGAPPGPGDGPQDDGDFYPDGPIAG